MSDPKTIFQKLLDDMSDAAAKGGADALMPFFDLPYLHEALDAKVMLEQAEDLRAGLQTFYETLKGKGVTQVIRLATRADYLSPNYIDGVYVSHLLHKNTPLTPCYTNRAVARQTPDGWKLTQTINGFSHKIWPIRVFYVPDDPPEYSIAGADDIRRDEVEPLAIYQTFANRLTQANVAGDTAAMLALCKLPYWLHTTDDDQEITNADQVDQFIKAVSEMMNHFGVEEFVRIADHAHFVSANEICGYHTAYFLSEGAPVIDPVKSRMILRRSGTRWFLHSVTNSLSKEDYPYRHLASAKELVTQLDIQKRTKTWPTLQ